MQAFHQHRSVLPLSKFFYFNFRGLREPRFATLGDRANNDGHDGDISSDSDGEHGKVQHGVNCGDLAFLALLSRNDATTLLRMGDLTTLESRGCLSFSMGKGPTDGVVETPP